MELTSPRRRGRQAAPAAALALVALLAVAAGAGSAVAPPELVLALIVALAISASVALVPSLGAYLLLALSPLLAGLDRGTLLPLLRPHEGLAVLVVAGFAVHLTVRAFQGRPASLRLPFGRVDRAILALAFCGSVVPLVFMVVRERPIELDDVLYALQVWKYYVVFLIVRGCVLTTEQVRTCLWVSLGAGAVVALVGILQVLHVPGISAVTQFYVADNTNEPLDRGSSTLASSIAVADVMVFSVAVAFGMLLQRGRWSFSLAGLLVLYVFGVLAAGQFSGFIALLIGLLAFGWITRRLSFTFVALAPIAGLGALLLRPVIEKRLSGFQGGSTLPQSWQVRLDNVTTYFWPVVKQDFNWITGVRPLARIEGPQFSGIDFIWIESGHVYLLWTGGIAFLLAFFWYAWVAIRTTARIARERSDAIGVAATASFTALVVITVLMILDPHLVMRGSADLAFSLLGLALVRPRGDDQYEGAPGTGVPDDSAGWPPPEGP